MSPSELIETLRDRLKPYNPDHPIVKLHLADYGFFGYEAVTAAIDELERVMLIYPATGEKVSPLQSLGIQLLLDSIDYRRENNTEEE